MKIYPTEVKRVIDSLPIGLYAKFRIPLDMDEKEECSFYNPREKCIVISYPQIAVGLESVEDESYIETAIRTMVYHEVSHALLTPAALEMTDIVNVFEDERIENLLAGYYHNVDFKKNIRLINNWDGICEPTNDFEKFYHTVRFRDGEPAHLKMVDDLIEKFAFMRGNEDPSYIKYYTEEIERLYIAITGKTPPEDGGRENGKGNGEEKKDGKPISDKTNKDKKPRGVCSDSEINPDFKKFGKDFMDNFLEDFLNYRMAKAEFDSSIMNSINILFENFKKRTGGGAAIQSYSGIINPRNIVRDDYKYFDRMAQNVGTNKFGSLHLNLFLDVSGSYQPNEAITNKIIIALEELEKKNKFFSFDVIACGVSEKKLSRKNRYIHPVGGNDLDEKIYQIFKDSQFPNTYNYNIVLFDGDAFSDAPKPRNTFSAFNVANCTIISDFDNRPFISGNVSAARVIYTRDYANELLKNILSALQLALR